MFEPNPQFEAWLTSFAASSGSVIDPEKKTAMQAAWVRAQEEVRATFRRSRKAVIVGGMDDVTHLVLDEPIEGQPAQLIETEPEAAVDLAMARLGVDPKEYERLPGTNCWTHKRVPAQDRARLQKRFDLSEPQLEDRTLRLPCHGIVVRTSRIGGGEIHSELRETKESPDVERYNAAIDGLESLILAHACAGVDILDPEYVRGVETAAEAVANYLM